MNGNRKVAEEEHAKSHVKATSGHRDRQVKQIMEPAKDAGSGQNLMNQIFSGHMLLVETKGINMHTHIHVHLYKY